MESVSHDAQQRHLAVGEQIGMVVVTIHTFAKHTTEGDDGSLIGLGGLGNQVAGHSLHSPFPLAAPRHILIDVLTAFALAFHVISIEIVKSLVKGEACISETLGHAHAAIRIMDKTGARTAMYEVVAGSSQQRQGATLLQGQSAAIILEKHEALRSHLSDHSSIGIKGRIVAKSTTLVSDCLSGHGQHTPHAGIYVVNAQRAVLNPVNYVIVAPLAAMLDIVIAGPDHLRAAVAATPVADYGTVVAPLLAENGSKQVAIL